MRDAVFIGWLVPSPYFDPYADDKRAGIFHLLHYHWNAVIKIAFSKHTF